MGDGQRGWLVHQTRLSLRDGQISILWMTLLLAIVPQAAALRKFSASQIFTENSSASTRVIPEEISAVRRQNPRDAHFSGAFK